MEFRKLIRFGKNSYVISLPKDWIKKNKLDKGDTVYLNKTSDSLQINAKEKEKKETRQVRVIVINTVKKKMDLIQTEIISSYIAGYSIIEIRGENIAKDALKIKAVLKDLAGIELIEETSNKIVAKDLIDIEEISIKVLIRRTDLLVRGMMDDMVKNVEEDAYESIYQRDKDVNRIVFLAKRVLRFACDNEKIRNMFNKSVIEVLQAWKIIGYLESLGDNIKRIARILTKIKLKAKSRNELNSLLLLLQKNYLDIMKAYHTKDLDIALKIELESKKRLHLIMDFEKKNLYIYDLIHNMKSMTSAIKHIARMVITPNI